MKEPIKCPCGRILARPRTKKEAPGNYKCPECGKNIIISREEKKEKRIKVKGQRIKE